MSLLESPPSRQMLDELDGLDAAREVLTPLAERASNLFGSWEWLSSWWRHFGQGRLLLATVRGPDASPVALLPLYLSGSRSLRALRFIGHGPADQLGPVAAPQDLPVAAEALGGLVRDGGLAWHVFLGHDLPCGPNWSEHLGTRTLYRTTTPVLDLATHGTWDAFLASRSQDFRRKARLEAKLARAHRVTYRLVTEPDELDSAFTTFVRLHEARWRGGSRSFAGSMRHFHSDFAALALERGWLRLLQMEIDGRPASALYNIRFAGCEYDYQAGRDPAFDSWSVGFLIRCRAIRMAIEDGVSEYRFLRGAEPYKWRFAGRDPGVVTVGAANGALGRAVLHGARWQPNLPQPLRWRVRGPLSPSPAGGRAS
jgi:CelD/BcsL family acetyltransferase involved in cellulose biosynthesis